MVKTYVEQRPVTERVIAALEDEGLVVGDGEAHEDGGWNEARDVYTGHVVVYSLAGGVRYGPLTDHEADATLVYQVSATGATAAQAEILVDRVGRAMAGLAGVVVGGMKISLVRHDFGTAQVRRDDEGEHETPLWYGTPRYRLWTTPA